MYSPKAIHPKGGSSEGRLLSLTKGDNSLWHEQLQLQLKRS